jgi:hypothetical protein
MRLKTIHLFCLISPYVLFAQKTVYSDPFETHNIHKDYQKAVSRSFEVYLNSEANYQLKLSNRMNDSIIKPRPIDEVRMEASKLGFPFYIKGILYRLGENVVVSVSLYDTNNGELIWSEKMKAINPDQLDPVLSKMANYMSGNNHIGKNEIFSVDKDNAEDFERNKSNKSRGAGLIAAYPAFHGAPVISSGLSINSLSTQRNLLLQSKFDVTLGIGDRIYSNKDQYKYSNFSAGFDIQTFYPFTKSMNFQPFLGGGMGLGFRYLDTGRPDHKEKEAYRDYDGFSGGIYLAGTFGVTLNSETRRSIRIAAELRQDAFNSAGFVSAIKFKIDIMLKKM